MMPRSLSQTGPEKRRFIWPKGTPQIIALLLVLLVDSLVAPHFYQVVLQDGRLFGSPIDILNRAAPVALLAIGMTLVIATGGIDRVWVSVSQPDRKRMALLPPPVRKTSFWHCRRSAVGCGLSHGKNKTRLPSVLSASSEFAPQLNMGILLSGNQQSVALALVTDQTAVPDPR